MFAGEFMKLKLSFRKLIRGMGSDIIISDLSEGG